jgi:hypothetical protein
MTPRGGGMTHKGVTIMGTKLSLVGDVPRSKMSIIPTNRVAYMRISSVLE